MSTNDMRCKRCEAPMQEGFLLDKAANNIGALQTEWVSGPFEDRHLLGMHMGMVKTKGHVAHDVVAYRCPQCASLELFAPAADTLSRPMSDECPD